MTAIARNARQRLLHSAKELLKRTPFFDPVMSLYHRRELRRWERNGKPVPPPQIVKFNALTSFATRFGIDTLVETGTFRGDTLWTLRNQFRRLHSIELSDELYQNALRRFRSVANVQLLQGDSAARIGEVLAALDRPALFWLDAHYASNSEGLFARGEKVTPIFEELHLILSHAVDGHVILIDDARLFLAEEDQYPPFDRVRSFILQRRPEWTVEVLDDIIRAYGAPRPVSQRTAL